MSTIFESFSISHAAVLDPTGIEAQQLYGVREGSLSAKINSYSCLADDQEIMTWYDIESVAVAITNGYLSFDAIAALLDVAVSNSGAAPHDFYSIPWGVQHVPTGGPVALVLRTVAKDSTGTSPRMSDILLYQVSVHDLQLTGPSYKSGMGVTYAGTAMWALQDETSTPLAQRQYGRLISSPGVPGPVTSTLFGAAGQSGGIIQTADAVAQGAGSVVALPAINLTQAQGAGSVASPDVIQKAGGTAQGKGAANVGAVLPVLVTGAGSVAATGKIAGVASPHGAGSVVAPHAILKVSAVAQGVGSAAASATTSGGGGGGGLLVGATVNKGHWPTTVTTLGAAEGYNNVIGRNLAGNVQKCYSQSADPTDVQSTLSQLTAHYGIGNMSFLISVIPSKSNTTADFNTLRAGVHTLITAGYNFAITIQQEPNAGTKFASPAAYRTYLNFYAPAVRLDGSSNPTGIQVVYDPSLVVGGGSSAVNFYPGDDLVDAFYVDYYATAHKSTLLDNVAALADGHRTGGTPGTGRNNTGGSASPIPLGIGEWGNSANGSPPSYADWHAYNNYIISFFKARAAAAKQNGWIIWFNDGGTPAPQPENQVDTVNDADFLNKYPGLGYPNSAAAGFGRIPDIRAVYDALNGLG